MTLDILEALQQEIENSLRTHMGSQTMCQLHKDGRVSGGLKYDEGRLVVVRAAMRKLRSSDEPALEDELAKWQQQLDRYQNQEPRSMPWIAYSQGGVDTLKQLIQNGPTPNLADL